MGQSLTTLFEGFDGALAAAILASGLMNALVGASCYVFYMRSSAPTDPVTHKIMQGCR